MGKVLHFFEVLLLMFLFLALLWFVINTAVSDALSHGVWVR